MKYLFTLLSTILLFACNANKNTPSEKTKKMQEKNYCPDNGICNFNVIKNSDLQLKKDAFGNTYLEINKGSKTLLKFTYIRNEVANTVDGNYQEIIYAEIDPSTQNIHLKDSSLAKVKLIFGRLCFCRGQTGYYPIKEGELSLIKNKDNTYNYTVSFTINEVPQIITLITEQFKF